MSDRVIRLTLFILFFITGTLMSASLQEKTDTAAINIMTREALSGARRNSDLSISIAYKALASSEDTEYPKGMADACLALGNSYLWKYKTDSACVYCKRAYALYLGLNENVGAAKACHTLAYVFSFTGDLEESEQYSNLSLGYFEKAGNHLGMANAYHVLSYLSTVRKEFERAGDYCLKAIEEASLAKDTLLLADVTNSLGNIYTEMTLFSQATDRYFEALRLWEKKNDSSGISMAYGNIGLIYFYQKDYNKAMEYNLKKLPVSESRNEMWELGKTYNNIAQVYNATQKYDSSLIYIRKCLRVYKAMNYTPGIVEASDNMASCLLMLSQVDSAYWYIGSAIDIAHKIEDPALPRYYVTLANVYQAMKKYEQALKYANEAYNLGKAKHLPLVVSAASKLLSDLYSKVNRDDLAYSFLKSHYQLKDSISNVEFLRQVTRVELEYEFDKKQKAAEYAQMQETMVRDNKIKQQRIYLKGLLVLLFLLALFSVLYLRHSQLRARYSRIDLEQRLLRAQMNPHFIFNSLCAVQDLILAEEPRKANAFLTKIARLMRNILENSREEFIALDKEIETLTLYIEVQQLRFETGFDYDIVIDKAIDPENFSVPPMFAQPCVENSIEHGLLPAGEKGRVSVCYSLKDNLMMLEVTDNGIGRLKAAQEPKNMMKKTSLSTHLNATRLDHFRKTLKERKITYEIIDLYDGDKASGTRVIMMLPYKKIFA